MYEEPNGLKLHVRMGGMSVVKFSAGMADTVKSTEKFS